MNTNINICLDERRQKKDNIYPVIMRLGHKRRTTSISLGISVLKSDWDDKAKVIKRTYKGLESVTRLNNSIQKKKADALDTILKLSEQGTLQTLSVTEVKNRILSLTKTQLLFEFIDSIISDLRQSGRIGTARSYKGVKDVLKTYVGGKQISIGDITYSFLQKFEIYHLQKGNAYNGLAVYMRTIRAIYNRAIKEGMVDKEQYPFDAYKIKTEPTEKRALDKSFIQKIISLDLETKHPAFHSRNFFVASFMMYGMNFKDMALLKKADIVHDRIHYRREKTSKLYDIKVTPNLEKILTYYSKNNKNSVYIFPILKREGLELMEKDIMSARKKYNKQLKKLAELCGIETNLTSYVSRHTFATQALFLNIPIKAISTMLGHSSVKTTETYLASLPSNVLDEFNEQILDQKAK